MVRAREEVWGAEWIFIVLLADIARIPEGSGIGLAANRMGGLAVSALPLAGPQGERGALINSPPPTVGPGRGGGRPLCLSRDQSLGRLAQTAGAPRKRFKAIRIRVTLPSRPASALGSRPPKTAQQEPPTLAPAPGYVSI